MDHPQHGGRGNVRLIAAGFIGNVLEWYDFAVYGFFAGAIGAQFFPSDNKTASLLASFGAFAVGFLMRPLGSILFGHVGDRYGRRRLLVISVLAMAFSTTAIGLVPTSAEIGAAAALLIVGLRMIQGLSVGGEYVGSGVFLAERAPQRRRGFFAGFSSAGLIIGMLLGSIVGILVNWSMPLEAVAAWGWRVPFLAGFLIGGVALVLRLTIAETGMPVPPSRAPVAEAISQYGAKILIATAGIMALAANWYTAVIYLPTWMVAQLGLERSLSLEINILSLGLAMIAGLVGAIVSDRVGRRPMLIAAALALAVFTFPLYLLLGRGNVISVAVAQACLMAICGCYTFALPTALAEMFPWRVRVSAASLSFNLAFAIFGGTAPVIATWLVAETAGLLPVAVYLSLLGALSAVAWLGVSLPFSGDLSRPGDCYDRRSVN